MSYIKLEDVKTSGRSGFQPLYSTPPALTKVTADAAASGPRTKGTGRTIFIDFIWAVTLPNTRTYWCTWINLDLQLHAFAQARVLLKLLDWQENINAKH